MYKLNFTYNLYTGEKKTAFMSSKETKRNGFESLNEKNQDRESTGIRCLLCRMDPSLIPSTT